MASPVEAVLEFEQLINSRNPDAVCGLLTEDSVFIDSLGNRMAGMDSLRSAWTGYFKMVPDYAISHTGIVCDGDTVAMFGEAQGTFSRDGQMKKEDFLEDSGGLARRGQGRQDRAVAGLCRQRAHPRHYAAARLKS